MKKFKIAIQKAFWLMLMVLVLGFFLTSWKVSKDFTESEMNKDQASMSLTAKIAATGIREVLLSTENYLSLLAKMPYFRKFKRTEALVPEIEAFQNYINDWADAYQFEFGFAYQRFLLLERTMMYWSEIPTAALRRLAYEFMPDTGNEDSEENEDVADDSNFSIFAPKLTKLELERIYRQTSFARELVFDLQGKMDSIFSPIVRFSRFWEHIAGLGYTVLAEKSEAEKFLSVVINGKGILTGLDVTNMFGKSQLDFVHTGVSLSPSSLEICEILQKGRAFWSGPVKFDEETRYSFWQIAAPIRNAQREFSGCIRASVNLKFLNEWCNNFEVASDTEIAILDKDFAILASSGQTQINNQISFVKNYFFSDNSSGYGDKSVFMKDFADGKKFLVQPLAKFRGSNLPGWKIMVTRRPSSEDDFYKFLTTFVLIILAAVGSYVLFYSAVQLNNLYEEGTVDDR